MAMSVMSPRMQISIPGLDHLSHLDVPTREQAVVAVAQVRDAVESMHLSSRSLRARATSGNVVNDRAMVAFRLLTENTETQEVVAQVVSDPNVFGAIWQKLQEIPVFRNIIHAVRIIREEATNCLIPRDREFQVEDEEISSFANRPSWWVRIFNMVVEAVSGIWNMLVDMFVSTIPRIQAAIGGEGGDSHAMETAVIITGLVVLVTGVIIMGAIMML